MFEFNIVTILNLIYEDVI